MIVQDFVVPTKTANKVYRLLSRDVGPAVDVKHVAAGSFFAQFGPFTLSSQRLNESGPCDLRLSFHEDVDGGHQMLYKSVSERAATLCAEGANSLDLPN